MLPITVLSIFIIGCMGLSPQCMDENGKPVDWFYIYKLPKNKSHPNQMVRRGVAYMYLTPDTLTKGWTMSSKTIRSPASMPGRTFGPLYEEPNIISLIYNDQPPVVKKSALKLVNLVSGSKRHKKMGYIGKVFVARSRRSTSKGHTKGVVLGDNNTAVWMVHSVPKYPPKPNFNVSYSYPVSGMKFGQSFLCVSISAVTLEQVAVQLKYNEPLIVHHNMPVDLTGQFPNLVDVMHNKTVDKAPWSHVQTFKSLAGRQFLSFAKTKKFNDDLYSALVAEQFKSDLFVESWINGPGVLNSECHKRFEVQNVLKVMSTAANMTFSSYNDHSKWTVTARILQSKDNVTNKWVCVGDINRAEPQKIRGGGTVCTEEPLLWEHYTQLIHGVKPCNETLKYYN